MAEKWWKTAVVYQIYPRSFMDANGDGVGDINGIRSKLDYLKFLGIDTIWLSPIYASPNDDNGYDISDYYAINPEFGTMNEFESLLRECHNMGLRLIMDLVVNHTSDEHAWFLESKKSRDNPKRDWYIWQPPKNGSVPNNWTSAFGGSAWEYDQSSGEYYLHLFSKKQPDLNWRNPHVREAVFTMMNWWFEKGIDGFRMDVINQIVKSEGYPDNPEAAHPDDNFVPGGSHIFNRPPIHEYLRDMNRQVLSRFDCFTIGETHCVTPQQALEYTAEDRHELDVVFQFGQMKSCGDLPVLKKEIAQWYEAFKGRSWNTVALNCHDIPRFLGNLPITEQNRPLAAKLLALLELTLPGTPFLYQGSEIGMINADFSSPDQLRDIASRNYYSSLLKIGEDPGLAFAKTMRFSRDNARQPMQWDHDSGAGFTTGTPWIDLNQNHRLINVASQVDDPDSIFSFYRALLRFRKEHPDMVLAAYSERTIDNPLLYVFERSGTTETYRVFLNFSDQPQKVDRSLFEGSLVCCNYESITDFSLLRPFECKLVMRKN